MIRILDEAVLCGNRMVRSCRELGCYSATLGAFCVAHAAAIAKPFCFLECNREFHAVSVGGDYPRDGACLNCGASTLIDA